MSVDMDPGPQYRKQLEPMLRLRDHVVILDYTGLLGLHAGGPLYQVTGIIPVPGIGQHGAIGLWVDPTTGTLTNQAGFKFDQNANNTHIGTGAEVRVSPVQTLALKFNQIGQFRLRFKAQPSPTGSQNDYDFKVYQPGGSLLWQSQNLQGSYNLADQVMDPGDNQLYPAQGQGETPGTVNVGEPDGAWSPFTEVVCIEDQSLTIGITNNGSAVTAAGAWYLRAKGFIFNLQGVAGGPSDTLLPGISVPVPRGKTLDDIKIVQYGYRDPYLGAALGGVGSS